MDGYRHSSRSRLGWPLAVVSLMLIAACGDGDASPAATSGAASSTEVVDSTDAPAATTTAPNVATTGADDDWPVEVELVGCDQFVSRTDVDPAVAAPFILEQELYVDVGGDARAILVTKDCDDFVVDGEALGPGHMDTLWVRVLGPAEGAPELPDEEAGGVDTFVPQFLHTDNAAFGAALAAHGVPMRTAESMSTDPFDSPERTGSATDSEFSPPLVYRWTFTDTRPAQQAGHVGHLLRSVTDDGTPIRFDIGCLYENTRTGFATVEFDAGGPFEALLGTGWTSPGYEMRLDCEIVIEPR